MSTKIVVTNLRIPEDEWLQVKTLASEAGMSSNQYIKQILKSSIASSGSNKRTKVKQTIYDALEKLAKTPNKPLKGELSKEDKIIYGE